MSERTITVGGVEIVLRVHLAWWCVPYLYALWTFCFVTRMKPDGEKVAKTLLKGLSVELQCKPAN